MEIGSWSSLSQQLQPPLEASEVNCQHPNQTKLLTTDLKLTSSSTLTTPAMGCQGELIMDVDIIGRAILAETSPPPHKDFGSSVWKEIKRWTRADFSIL